MKTLYLDLNNGTASEVFTERLAFMKALEGLLLCGPTSSAFKNFVDNLRLLSIHILIVIGCQKIALWKSLINSRSPSFQPLNLIELKVDLVNTICWRLAIWFPNKSKLKVLALQECQLSDEDARLIAIYISKWHPIELGLSVNNISEIGATLLMAACANSSIKKLDLHDQNPILPSDFAEVLNLTMPSVYLVV